MLGVLDMMQNRGVVMDEVEMNVISQSGRHLYKLLIGVLPPNDPTLALLGLRFTTWRAQPTVQQHSAAKRTIVVDIQLSPIYCQYIRMGKVFAVP